MLMRRVFGWVIVSLLVSSCVSHLPVLDTPETLIRTYYAAVNSGACQRAAELRPGYDIRDCQAVDVGSVTVDSVRAMVPPQANIQLFELALRYAKGRHDKSFNGYLAVFKDRQGRWYIDNNSFIHRDDISDSAYVQRYGYLPQPPSPPVAVPQPIPAMPPPAIAQPLPPSVTPPPIAQPLPPRITPPPVVIPEPPPPSASTRIVVDVSRQQLDLYYGNTLRRSYPVSTSKFGEGSRAGTGRTPLGSHVIADKIGDGALPWTIFKARVNTRRIASAQDKDAGDLVTTRILWLKGLEPGKNQGSGIDSYRRYIYIHGTAEEHLIGRKASHGCIRMYNNDVVELFKLVNEGTPVDIQL